MVKRATLLVIATTLFGTGIVATASAPAAAASKSARVARYSGKLLGLVNHARERRGLRTLRFVRGTTEVASHWADHMTRSNDLAHNPNLQRQLETHGSPNWRTYGENVGYGQSASSLFHEYMHSPEHRANILDRRFRYIGIGVGFRHGYSFNVLDFVDRYKG